MERNDTFGRWISDNNGVTWILVEASQVFRQEQVPDPQFAPLDATGALATLLVVAGALSLQDAANAIHEEPQHLEHEALAWSLG